MTPFKTTFRSLLFISAMPVFAFASIAEAATPEEFTLSVSLEKAARVSLGSVLKADPEGEAIARQLMEVLGKMTGQEWASASIEEADDTRGIVLAVAADFPELAAEASLDSVNPFGREDYLIRTSGDRLLVLGATPLGVRRGVADLLHRWGYRQFFPGKAWEIVPKLASLTLRANDVQRPAYAFRDMFTVNYLPGEEAAYEQWCAVNRMGSGFQLNTRHAYLAIYRRHEETFAKNLDYFASVDGVPQDAATQKKFKFNAASPGLIDLIVKDARTILSKENAEDSISMDPSDFGGWDNSGEAFKKIGSPSNQAVTMANAVAREAAAPLGKYVGMYAYYDHQFAPEIPVEPNIIVSFATRFLKPGQDLFELINAWKNKGVKHIGIRDYSSYWNWDLAMPGRALGGNLDYLKQSFERYHRIGARFYTSEFQSAWGAYGLGFYATSRLLWNPAEDVTAMVNDFLEKSFGPAAAPMGRFYSLLNGEDSVLARFTEPAKFYAPLLEALEAAKEDEAVTRRITELLAYVRYVELLGNLEKATQDKKPEALLALYDWLFRSSPFQMLPTKAIALRSKNAMHIMYPALSHPNPASLVKMQADAATRPVTLEELTGHASEAVAAVKSISVIPRLVSGTKSTNSPWIRNAAAFVFPLEAESTTTVTLTMRRFGFSGWPRYAIMDPSGGVATRGRLEADSSTVEFKNSVAGNYTLVIEPTPNLIKCQSDRTFFLEPSRDAAALEMVNFKGLLYGAVPGVVASEIVAGGQGANEKINAEIYASGKKVASGKDVSGDEPLVHMFSKSDNATEFHVRIGKPSTGSYEDQFLKIQGGPSFPVSISPEARVVFE